MDAEEIQLFAAPRKKQRKVAGGAPATHNSSHESKAQSNSKQLAAQADTNSAATDADNTQPQTDVEPSAAGAASSETFKELGLSDWLCTVCKSLGMARPTNVQSGCVPAILAGRDVIGLAQTGSGKTAAFALPILQLLARDPYGVFALVLTPTRELAIQISEQFMALGAGMSLKECVIIGGVDMQKQAKELARRPHVVIATPGRLKGLIDADGSLAAGFARCRFLVLDEADRLLDPTFESDLRTILAALPGNGDADGADADEDAAGAAGGAGGAVVAVRPRGVQRQTLLFSATMTKALIKLQGAALNDAYVYQAYEGLRTADKLREQYVFMPAKVKEVYLAHVLDTMKEHKVRSAIIFCGTCKGCHLLSLLLEELGVPCAALHSGKSQKGRLAALQAFKSEAVPLLLATDVASRGLDIPTVDLVVNFDLPVLARDYVHRVGRTARAGRSGWSLSFVTQYDIELVHKIEELLGHQLQEFKMDEETVLKGITRVYSARRAAMLRVGEEQGVDTKRSRLVKKAAKNM